MSADQDALALNQAMQATNCAISSSNERITALAEEYAALRVQERHNTKIIRLLTISLIIGLLALVGGGFAMYRSLDNTWAVQRLVHHNQVAIYTACLSTNEARSKTALVWEMFTHIAAPAPTDEEQTKIEELLGFVSDTYPQRDCGAKP